MYGMHDVLIQISRHCLNNVAPSIVFNDSIQLNSTYGSIVGGGEKVRVVLVPAKMKKNYVVEFETGLSCKHPNMKLNVVP